MLSCQDLCIHILTRQHVPYISLLPSKLQHLVKKRQQLYDNNFSRLVVSLQYFNAPLIFLNIDYTNPFIVTGYNNSGNIRYVKNISSNCCIFLPPIQDYFTWYNISIDPKIHLSKRDIARFLNVVTPEELNKSTAKVIATKLYFVGELKGKLIKQTFTFSNFSIMKLKLAYFEIKQKQFTKIEDLEMPITTLYGTLNPVGNATFLT